LALDSYSQLSSDCHLSPRVLGVRGVLGKTQVPHWIDKTLDKSLYRGGNLHLTSRFCKDELGPKISNMVSELVEFKGHLPIHAPSPKSAGREGGVLGKTQVPRWIDKTLDKSLYRGGNPHLTSRFCKDELGPKISNSFVVFTLINNSIDFVPLIVYTY